MYIYISTIIFVFLAIAWTGRHLANVMIKFTLIGMAIYGVVLSLEQMGYIIQR